MLIGVVIHHALGIEQRLHTGRVLFFCIQRVILRAAARPAFCMLPGADKLNLRLIRVRIAQRIQQVNRPLPLIDLCIAGIALPRAIGDLPLPCEGHQLITPLLAGIHTALGTIGNSDV